MPAATISLKLPVSLICPVRNSMSGLPHHVEHLRKLAPLVGEIIVVDSQSNDGTVDYLKEHLADFPVTWLDHPPGLYQSWNHAISKATQPYLTVATVGDTLPASSLVRLVETIQRFSADAVISAPVVLGKEREVLGKKYAIHDYIESHGITDAEEVDGLTWLMYFIFYMPSSLLCSSAGNLYRTSLLQEHPFPLEYGHAGDSAWSLQMSLKTKWVVDAKVEAFFWEHHVSPHKLPISRPFIAKMQANCFELLEKSRDRLLAAGFTKSLLDHANKSTEALCRAALLMEEYRAERISILPRFLQPKAARLLARKNEANAERKTRLRLLNEHEAKRAQSVL